ncbi:MAG: hypothetical protein EG824_01965 [Deltaproteobacteria bacterium]|nr:hypothetical protein [Deltaproteobacteria bacterium]
MIRGEITEVTEGAVKRFSATGRDGETIEDREYAQHYGFTSRPLAGCEAVIIREGNHYLMIASDDRRYRLAVEAGEAALYDDQGQKVHLTRAGIMVSSPLRIDAQAPEIRAEATERIEAAAPLIDAQATEKITAGAPEIEATATTKITASAPEIAASASTKITASAPEVDIAATVKVVMTTPLVEISGDLTVAGDAHAANVTATGDVADQDGAKTMAGMRTAYNAHQHAETSVFTLFPSQEM